MYVARGHRWPTGPIALGIWSASLPAFAVSTTNAAPDEPAALHRDWTSFGVNAMG